MTYRVASNTPSGPFSRGASPDGVGVPRVFWAIVALAYFLAFAVASHLAPGGQWTNELFDSPMWLENDPGGWYFTGASELFVSSEPVFPGHPGLPLQLLLNGIQRLGYLASDDSMSFTSYLARQLYGLYFVSKLTIILLHLLSFALLFYLARSIGLSELDAQLASLAYATSLPVLYYANRISVEPFVMAFFLATLVLMFKTDDSRKAWTRRALGLSAGACATLAALSKAHLMAAFPLVPVAFLFRSLGRRHPGTGWDGGLGAIVGVSLTALSSTLLLDGSYFLGVWQAQVGPSAPLVLERLADWEWIAIALAATGARVYWLETGFFLIGGLGCYRLYRGTADTQGGERERFRWVFGYGSLTALVWAFRVLVASDFHGFHYLFPMIGVLALGFGFALGRALTPRTRRFRLAAGCAFISLVHAASVAAAADTKKRDVDLFGDRVHFRWALEQLPAGQRIAVIGNGHVDLVGLSGLSDSYSSRDEEVPLLRSFEACFVPVRRAQLDQRGLDDHLRRLDVAYVIDLEAPLHVTVQGLEQWKETIPRRTQ